MRLASLMLLFATVAVAAPENSGRTIDRSEVYTIIGKSEGTTVAIARHVMVTERPYFSATLLQWNDSPMEIPAGLKLSEGVQPGTKYLILSEIYAVRCQAGTLALSAQYYSAEFAGKVVASRILDGSQTFSPKPDTIAVDFHRLACEYGVAWKAEKQQMREQEAKPLRLKLKTGDETNCGMVIEVKPPLAKVETPENGTKHFRINQLYQPTESCRFEDGRYITPNE